MGREPTDKIDGENKAQPSGTELWGECLGKPSKTSISHVLLGTEERADTRRRGNRRATCSRAQNYSPSHKHPYSLGRRHQCNADEFEKYRD